MSVSMSSAFCHRAAGALAGLALVVLAVLGGPAQAVDAATIAVTTTGDDITPNNGSVSLREAITAINAGNNLGDPDIIAQTVGTFGTNDTINFNIAGAGIRTINVGTHPTAAGLVLPTI